MNEDSTSFYTGSIFVFLCRVSSLFTRIDVFCGEVGYICGPFSLESLCRNGKFGWRSVVDHGGSSSWCYFFLAHHLLSYLSVMFLARLFVFGGLRMGSV